MGCCCPACRASSAGQTGLPTRCCSPPTDLHVPWAMPGRLLTGALYAWLSRRYRSALLGIAVHSAQTVVLGALVLALVLDKR